MKNWFLFLFLCLLFISCSYKYKSPTSPNGKLVFQVPLTIGNHWQYITIQTFLDSAHTTTVDTFYKDVTITDTVRIDSVLCYVFTTRDSLSRGGNTITEKTYYFIDSKGNLSMSADSNRIHDSIFVMPSSPYNYFSWKDRIPVTNPKGEFLPDSYVVVRDYHLFGPTTLITAYDMYQDAWEARSVLHPEFYSYGLLAGSDFYESGIGLVKSYLSDTEWSATPTQVTSYLYYYYLR